jgi:hypothetical protein
VRLSPRDDPRRLAGLPPAPPRRGRGIPAERGFGALAIDLEQTALFERRGELTPLGRAWLEAVREAGAAS